MKLLKDLLYDVRIEEVFGTTNIAVESLSNDSRKCKSMGLFVAIKGSKFNGHDYIASALANGSTAIVCENVPEGAKNIEGTTFIKVKNSSEAIGHIASAFYDKPSSEMKIIAVTGTNGKTTSVSLLHSLFRIMDRKAGLIGTVENKINDKSIASTHTTPDAILLQKLFKEMVEEGSILKEDCGVEV